VKRQTIASLGCALFLTAGETSAADARADFLAAEAMLESGDRVGFERLADELRDYPLSPYLRFEDLMGRLAGAEPDEVRGFLRDHGDTPLADRLRRAWLQKLADQDRWSAYADVYVPDDSPERRCHYLNALIQTGRVDVAFSQTEGIWLSGQSRPAACDPLFDAWRDAGHLVPELVWRRIALAMERGNVRLARYLGRYLPLTERPWLERWLRIHAEPEQLLDAVTPGDTHPRRAAILVHGVERLAERSAREAAAAWDRLDDGQDLAPLLAERALAAVGLALAEAGERRGLGYLGRIAARADNLDLQDRRLRAALRLQAWPQVGAWAASMPEGEHKAELWLYWQARAMEAQGQDAAARRLYRQAAGERSLWGFLAAERLGMPHQLESRPTPAAEERLTRIEQSPAGRRISELLALTRGLDARREIQALVRGMDPEDLMAAAVLIRRWGWPDQAIFTLARSGYWDDLELRFPIHHRELVRRQAGETGLDESWIFAVLRQESAFNPQVVSHAGALGLMQLMPATAREVARSLGEPPPSRWALLDPEINIRLGSAYLAHMQARFNDHPALAAAAYNAGPHRVERWLPSRRTAADIWLATIPFRETRRYVRRVLAYRLIYDHRLGREIRPLSALLRPVGGTDPQPVPVDFGEGT
jgi:soluble lytic murein transglycosylase